MVLLLCLFEELFLVSGRFCRGESLRGCCAFGTLRGDDVKNRSKLEIISLIILGCWPHVCAKVFSLLNVLINRWLLHGKNVGIGKDGKCFPCPRCRNSTLLMVQAEYPDQLSAFQKHCVCNLPASQQLGSKGAHTVSALEHPCRCQSSGSEPGCSR